jgi:tRNA-2-methylthio-N6-dimethylallyladenosine synthase
MTPKQLYMRTIGCQMNVHDSQQMVLRLAPSGYLQVDDEGSADLIVVNTCAIRAKAEQKVFSYLGRLAERKRNRPGLIIAVGGCVAQQSGAAILRRMPAVDIVFGTDAVDRLADLVAAVEAGNGPVVDIEPREGIADALTGRPDSGPMTVSRFVTIMQGCDNHCTYCVVPTVRGPEKSRDPEQIVAEVSQWVALGVKEVTLLGQNVNSYGVKEGLAGFPQLLEQVNRVPGLERIRFTTSHPKDLSDDLIAAFGRLEKLCGHIHLPVQSGSDRILRRMNRRYDRAGYLEKVGRLRAVCPDIAVTSDFIVGFPGETDTDFEQTLALIDAVGFDGLFAFEYSDRPNAPAARYDRKVTAAVKRERLHRLLALQERHSKRRNRALVGSTQPVLVEGRNPRSDRSPAQHQWTGRTPGNKIVHLSIDSDRFPGGGLVGRLADVHITQALAHSLIGHVQPPQDGQRRMKGEQCHAA